MAMEKNDTNPYGMALKQKWQCFFKYFNDRTCEDLLKYRTLNGETAFQIAAASGDHKLLKRLLAKVEKESRNLLFEALVQGDIHGNTAVHEVATTDYVEAAYEILKVILECSEKENEKKLLIPNKLGETPFYRAAALGRTKMLRYFDKKVGCSPDHFHRNDKISILHIAVIGQHFDTAIWVLGKDKQLANEEMDEKDGMTALQLLALMPDAFKSSSPMMKTWKSFFYSLVKMYDDDDDNYYFKEDLETGKMKKELSYLKKQTGCLKIINKIRKEKRKHKKAAKLVELLVEKDKSWEERQTQKEEDTTISLGLGKGSMDKLEHKKLVDVSATEFFKLMLEKYKLPEVENKSLEGKSNSKMKASLSEIPIVFPENKDSLSEIPIVFPESKDSLTEIPIVFLAGKDSSSEIPLIFAASNGITEIFNEIIKQHPEAIHYVNDKGENVLHVAIMYRQHDIIECIKNYEICKSKLATRIDNDGNTILHHVANTELHPGSTRAGPALQYQEELELFEWVQDIMPNHYVMHRNKTKKITASDLFEETHADQLKEAQKWIKETAQSCSTLSILLATVVFAVAFTVPGGNNDKGFPNFLHSSLFYVFSIMDVVSLALSLTSFVMFLSILTSAFEPQNFLRELPTKMMAGFTFLFFSVITSMVTFSASLLLVIRLDKKWTFAIYSAAFFPVVVLALLQLPFYASLVGAMKNLLVLALLQFPFYDSLVGAMRNYYEKFKEKCK